MNLKRIKIPGPGEHPSNEWAAAQANPSSFYPAVVPYMSKPIAPKRHIKYTPEMMAWLEDLQKDALAFKRLRRIAGGIFNKAGNEQYIEKPGEIHYVPERGPAVAQPVASVNQLVNVTGKKHDWVQIETIPVGAVPADKSPSTHPWLFNNPFTSIRVGDNELGNAIDSRGVIVPLYGEGWLPADILEDVTAAAPKKTLSNQGVINSFYRAGLGWFGLVRALGATYALYMVANRSAPYTGIYRYQMSNLTTEESAALGAALQYYIERL